jgi:bifunctional non-homologous end joining protein LigD
MMAKLYDKAFEDPNWVFEIKWDGYRAVCELDGVDTKLYSRNGLSFEEKYPEVYEALSKLKKKAVIDGEIVALDEEGNPSFQMLQQYEPGQTQLVYYVFDCLQVNGTSIEEKTLLERKVALKKILPANNDTIRFCEHITEKGEDFFEATRKHGLEGMIAKRADSRYREGQRSDDWLKVKQVQTEEAVICGYTAPRGGRKFFGALVLGMYVKGKLTYIGHTGTGFDHKTLRDLHKQLQNYKSAESPFDTRIPVNAAVTWVRPELVCNLKYSEITSEGIRRHPVFMGLRVDKAAKEASTEAQNIPKKKDVHSKTTDMDKERTIAGKKVSLTNLDKIFWPDEGYTKGDLIEYYDKIYKYIGKYLKDRPQSLRRTPNGIKDEGFFHKDAGDNAPEWVDNYPVWSDSADKEINYIVCNNKPTLLYMANMGCIEINPWNSKIDKPDNPDYFVMDIDPSDKNTFDQVVETAHVIREILDRAGCPSYCKTSGATGLHIYVPLAAKYSYEQAREFAHMIAVLTQEELPDFTSLERSLKKRGKDSIYIDYLQNRPGQTLSSVYSARPKPGAPVSTPLDWKEVKPGIDPKNYNIMNIFKRLEKKGDLFAPVLKKGVDIMKAIKKLGG